MSKKRKAAKALKVDTIAARSIQLIDEKGRLRAYLLAVGDTVHFNMCDENATPRLTLSLDPKGEPHIVLYGHNRHAAVSLGAINDGQAGISIVNVNKPRDRMRLGIQKGCDPHPDSETKARILIAGPDGTTQLEVAKEPSRPKRTK